MSRSQVPTVNKTEEVRKFIKKLPKNKWIDLPFIVEKFNIRRSTAFVIMDHLKVDLKLKTQLVSVPRDNGQSYRVRVFYK